MERKKKSFPLPYPYLVRAAFCALLNTDPETAARGTANTTVRTRARRTTMLSLHANGHAGGAVMASWGAVLPASGSAYSRRTGSIRIYCAVYCNNRIRVHVRGTRETCATAARRRGRRRRDRKMSYFGVSYRFRRGPPPTRTLYSRQVLRSTDGACERVKKRLTCVFGEYFFFVSTIRVHN